ncbi:uncharacterized protein FA14DRAFT_182124 [Meira miltonrushii]|uniref:Uncharacterized protein n=1 Tax=Meira miltonrushii TaxID=1280837 RepID=A0A316V6U1_9BASI|nr:uncharacterized protein FA14DRAFT_182124 [Meira miltonrushii]PWN32211.1 hypothetical protein FA14DRAFT_182124 [Meira miltonrushii]
MLDFATSPVLENTTESSEMKYFNVLVLLVFMLNVYVDGSPMDKQKKVKPDTADYVTVPSDQIANHKSSEKLLASASMRDVTFHSDESARMHRFHPGQLYHSYKIKRANKNLNSHLSNLKEIDSAQAIGSLKVAINPKKKNSVYMAVPDKANEESNHSS